MPIATGYSIVAPRTLPYNIEPVDGIIAGNIIMPQVTLGGKVLNSPVSDSNGIFWVLQSLAGWDAADVRTTQTPRAGDQGMFHEPAYYGARLLVATGYFASIAGTPALMAAQEQLHAAMNIVGTSLSPLVVNESPPKMCMVQRMAGTKDAANSAVSYAYQLNLLAPDPRKYDPSPSSVVIPANTIASIVNLGSEESRPTLTITGPILDLFASNLTTGQNLLFGVSLGPADVFVVDLDFKSASLNGSPASYTVASPPSQWWSLVPGVNKIEFVTTGTGTMTVSYRSAWV